MIAPLEPPAVTDDPDEHGSTSDRPQADDGEGSQIPRAERDDVPQATGRSPVTDGEAVDSEGPRPSGNRPQADDRVELALDLLAHLERDDLPLSAVVDRIETVTTDPTLTRTILDEAELRGLIEREDGRIRVRRGGFVSFESDVVVREGDFDCRRCGADLSTGHFVAFDAGELGPFGSSCVRKVLGRD